MAERRKLTEDEKKLIRDHALKEARDANPGAHVDVQIDDYTDEDGIVGRRVIATREKLGERP